MNSSSSPWLDTAPGPANSAARTAGISLVLASVALATALANGLVLAAVVATPKLRHPANYLICSLAVADLLVALLVMPPGAAAAATGSWPLGRAACAVWTSADVTCCTASILSLCAIALDRYCAIARAVRYAPRRTPRRAATMIAAVWVSSVLVSLPLALATVGGGGAEARDGRPAEPRDARLGGAAAAAARGDVRVTGGNLGGGGGGGVSRTYTTAVGVGGARTGMRSLAQPAVRSDPEPSARPGARPDARPDSVPTQPGTHADAHHAGTGPEVRPSQHVTVTTVITTAASRRASQPGAKRDSAAARRRCATRHSHVLYAVVCTVGAFYAPMALLLVLYCGIYRAARSHFRRGSHGGRITCRPAPDAGVTAVLAASSAPRQGEAHGQDGHGRYPHRRRLRVDDGDDYGDCDGEVNDDGRHDVERERVREMERVEVSTAGGQAERAVVKRDGKRLVDSQPPVIGVQVSLTESQVPRTTAQISWMESPLHHSWEERASEPDSDFRARVEQADPQGPSPGTQVPETGSQVSHTDVPSLGACQASKPEIQTHQRQPQVTPDTDIRNSGPQLTETERLSQIPPKLSGRPQPDPELPSTNPQPREAASQLPQKKYHVPQREPGDLAANSAPGAAAPVPAGTASMLHRCRSLSASLRFPQAARGAECRGPRPRPRPRRISESRERRAAKTLGLILGAFTLCWLPFFVRELVVNVCEACAPHEVASELISWLGYANSLVNPLIYTTFNDDFRAAFKRMARGGRGRTGARLCRSAL